MRALARHEAFNAMGRYELLQHRALLGERVQRCRGAPLKWVRGEPGGCPDRPVAAETGIITPGEIWHFPAED